MTGPWELGHDRAGWYVMRWDDHREDWVQEAYRITHDGTTMHTWPTREAAERAAARLNRKWAHECPGLYDCNLHPVPHVGRSRFSRGWYGGKLDCFSTYPTHAEAFAAALEHAKEKEA